jgi:hypothetical protein
MTALEVLAMATLDGVTLRLSGERLQWSAGHELAPELLDELKFHKLEIVETLRGVAEQRWLAVVAHLLECSPAYLLEQGFIDQNDLVEQRISSPQLTAQLIQSHPTWITAPTLAQSLSVDRPKGQPPYVRHINNIAVPVWRQTYEQYIGHLMTCRSCYAPTGHYCAAGARMRSRYNATH